MVVKHFKKTQKAKTSEEKNQANTVTDYFSLYPVCNQLSATET